MIEQGLSQSLLHFLEKLSADELINLSLDCFSEEELQRFWSLACEKFYQLTPLPGQKSAAVFWGEYIYQKASLLAQGSLGYLHYLLEAAQYNNFNALASLSTWAIAKEDYAQALAYAEKASMTYGTPGFLLIANVYRESASRHPSGSEKAKYYALQALKYLNMAIATAQNSELAMQNTGCVLPSQGIEHFRNEFIQIGGLTPQDIYAVSQANNLENNLAEH